MKTSIGLALGFYSAIAQSMCYIVENGAGQTVYISERPPVNMAAESPSKEVQARYPDGHMLIVPECPLTSSQHEARRLQAILDLKTAAKIRQMQAQAPAAESSYFPAERAQPVFYAGTLSQDDSGYSEYGYYGSSGYYGGAYLRPVRGFKPQGPHVSHYARRDAPVEFVSAAPSVSRIHPSLPIAWQPPSGTDYQSVSGTAVRSK